MLFCYDRALTLSNGRVSAYKGPGPGVTSAAFPCERSRWEPSQARVSRATEDAPCAESYRGVMQAVGSSASHQQASCWFMLRLPKANKVVYYQHHVSQQQLRSGRVFNQQQPRDAGRLDPRCTAHPWTTRVRTRGPLVRCSSADPPVRWACAVQTGLARGSAGLVCRLPKLKPFGFTPTAVWTPDPPTH